MLACLWLPLQQPLLTSLATSNKSMSQKFYSNSPGWCETRSAREMRLVAPTGQRGEAGAVRSGELFCTPVAVQSVTMALHGPTSRVAAS